jgi:hypothetical protein
MSFVTPAVPPPSAPTDLPCALPSTSPLAATPESLAKFTLKELKERCRSAGTPVTGSKVRTPASGHKFSHAHSHSHTLARLTG